MPPSNNLVKPSTESTCIPRYAYGIVKNHPFADGNKRTGGACVGMFLGLNEIRFKPRHDELLQTVYALADGSLSYDKIVAWIEEQL